MFEIELEVGIGRSASGRRNDRRRAESTAVTVDIHAKGSNIKYWKDICKKNFYIS